MGKRKKSSRKPQGPRKNEPLATSFTCLFCNHEKSVSVKIDRRAGVGALECKMCGQKFQCGINYLSAPIDVYSEWVDAADSIATGGGSLEAQEGARAKLGMSTRIRDEDDDRGGGYEGEDIVADDEEYD